MSNQDFKKPEFRRETRLGLVVYGGVALAIYMNGVCREFYNAVRGRGIYKLIKALTDSDIVVDIISGTSAGGINGVLLSYALTNSTADEVVDFKDFAQVWRENGDILKLMRHPGRNKSDAQSILDGEGYYQTQLKKAFDKVSKNPPGASDKEWYSESSELDLFVTGTNFFGRVYNTFDDTGCLIEIKDHRTVFHLKHRQERKEPFKPSHDTHEALAKLCRITSCFPVAFPVVDVEVNQNLGLAENSDRVNQNLIQWGQLDNPLSPRNPQNNSRNVYFVDGGVLDNRPFSYTIKEIYYRTAYRPVDRRLFYIDPSPDSFSNNGKQTRLSQPNTLKIIQDSLVGIPTYESIGNDLQLIKEHNEKVRRYRSLLADAKALIAETEAADNAMAINSEDKTPGDSVPKTLEKEDRLKEIIYLRSRLISLRDRVLPLVLRMDEVSNNPKKQADLERVANLLTEEVTKSEKEKREELRRKVFEQIRNLDVEYALRKHFYLLQNLCSLMEKQSNQDEYDKIQRLSKKITRQVKLLEVVREALNQLLVHKPVSDAFYELMRQEQEDSELRHQFYNYLLRLHRFLLNVNDFNESFSNTQSVLEKTLNGLPLQAKDSYSAEWLTQKQLTWVLSQLKQKVSHLEKPSDLENAIWNNTDFNYDSKENESTILRKVELASEALIDASELTEEDRNLIKEDFARFRKLDQFLYPFDYLTNIIGKELIQTVRISPSDAKRGLGSGVDLEDKLAGDTLYAFGGFFKKSWRSNDILWGRLDGLNRLVEALLTPEAVAKFPEFVRRQHEFHNKTEDFATFKKNYFKFIVDECFPKDGFSPDVPSRVCSEIIDCLDQLADPDKLKRSQSGIEGVLDKLIDRLVMEGHRRIVNTDFPSVVQDGITEQIDWNRQKVNPAVEEVVVREAEASNKIKYRPIDGYFDQMVSSMAAVGLAKRTIDELSSGDKENFFRTQCKVGQETVLNSIPKVVLANLSARFGLILRDITLKTLGDRAVLLRRSMIFNVLDKSLQLFYFWLQLKAPGVVRTPVFLQRFILVSIQVLLLLVAIAGVVVTVWRAWKLLLVTLIAVLLCWLLQKILE